MTLTNDGFRRRWLSDHPVTPPQLLRWLQNYDRPPWASDGVEPHQWIAAIEPDVDAFALVLRELLEMRPDVERPGRRPDQVIYNALRLAVDLRRPAALGPSLLEIASRPNLRESWRGVPLRAMLRDALIVNQTDDRLTGVWVSALQTRIIDPFPCGPIDAIVGLCLMPLRTREDDAERVRRVAEAIGTLANMIEDPHATERFRLVVRLIYDRYGACLTNDDVLVAALESRWPEWAVRTHPEIDERVAQLLYPSEDGKRETTRMFIREAIARKLSQHDYHAVQVLTDAAYESARACGLMGSRD